MAKTKIGTTIQARKALLEIERRTLWTTARVARELGWPAETLRKIVMGITANTAQKRMDQISNLLDRVRKL